MRKDVAKSYLWRRADYSETVVVLEDSASLDLELGDL